MKGFYISLRHKDGQSKLNKMIFVEFRLFYVRHFSVDGRKKIFIINLNKGFILKLG